MALADAHPDARSTVRLGPPFDVEIVIPVYNEEAGLARSVERLRRYLDERFPFGTVVTIADNASTDGTWAVAQRLASGLARVRALHLDDKGRGRALRAAWLASDAKVVAYMDVDLSTDLDALLPLVAPLLSGHSEVAIGTRLAAGSNVRRGSKRELISRSYNLLVRSVLGTRFSDAQCGFKAVTREAAGVLVPMVHDDEWFFDTELLVLAHRNGLRIHEVPVDWIDDPDSSVDIGATARADLAGICRLVRSFAAGKGRASRRVARHPRGESSDVVRIAGVGVASTVAYLVLFALWRPVAGAYLASAAALVCTCVVNTLVHAWSSANAAGYLRSRRRLTAIALATMVSLAVTSGCLWLAGVAFGTSGPVELLAVAAGTMLAVPLRFAVGHAATFADQVAVPRTPEPAPEAALIADVRVHDLAGPPVSDPPAARLEARPDPTHREPSPSAHALPTNERPRS